MVKYLSIGPGSMGFFFYAGFLSKMKTDGHLDNLAEMSGSSAGSILTFLYLLTGGDLSSVLSFALDVPISNIMKPNLKSLVSEWGLVPFSKSRKVLQSACEKFIGKPDVTFKELFAIRPIKFHVAAYCVDDHVTEYFSVDSHPNTSVIDAVTASYSIPFLFSAVKIGEKLYIDGALQESSPSRPFLNKDEALCVMIDLDLSKRKIKSLKDFGFEMLNYILRMRNEYTGIRTVKAQIDFDVHDFGMKNETKLKLFISGNSKNYLSYK
jgi:predicted acylesterase/phospholipase RssA